MLEDLSDSEDASLSRRNPVQSEPRVTHLEL